MPKLGREIKRQENEENKAEKVVFVTFLAVFLGNFWTSAKQNP